MALPLPPEQFDIGAGLHSGIWEAPISSELPLPLDLQAVQHPPPPPHWELLSTTAFSFAVSERTMISEIPSAKSC